MTGSAGLRRFVPAAAGAAPPATAAASAPAPAVTGPPANQPAGSGGGPQTGGPGVGWEGGDAGVRRQAAEKCELCAVEIPGFHGHVADLDHASLLCACRACYLLFTHSQAGRGRYRAVPDRYVSPARPMTAAEWEDLEIPVGLAFFLRGSETGTVTAFYPSPAGATECRLDLAAWDRLAAAHPLLGEMAPDVEAILISRADDGTTEHFLVPIDACYELAGRMRLHWRGFDGGAEARQSIAEFLGDVRSRARPLRGQES